MLKKLVIVESPAKARTLNRILGNNYTIKASSGHVRDLPQKSLGVDVTRDFEPEYVLIPQKRKLIRELKEIANSAAAIYLATDPDREGEAIAWHLVEAAKLDKDKIPIRRVTFHEITKGAVEQAFSNPGSINMHLVNAQQARRILDRLVGYKLSPLLWRKVQRGLSAGRVQSAAVRIVVDRERQIEGFSPTEYWTIEAELIRALPQNQESSFGATLVGLGDGTKLAILNQSEAERITAELDKASYAVKMIQAKEVARQPVPPFITSTLQQEAWRKLRFSAKQTMAIAQGLYEGLPIGDEGSVGLITYMRTDSTHIAAGAIAETRDFIAHKYGTNFLPPQPRTFVKKSKWAQEAHEAIRPTKIYREPSQLHPFLNDQQLKLYELIWKRMIASQMPAALFDTITIDIEASCTLPKKEYLLRATSSSVKFQGFMVIYTEGKDESEPDKAATAPLPKLEAGDKLELLGLFPEQHFTQPPARYTEATLIKALEQKGIGRPSTYAPILSTIQDRNYVQKSGGKFHVDELGFIVNDLLAKHFPKIIDLDFTAQMEAKLDKIAQGKEEWVPLLQKFYFPFEKTLHKASEQIEKINIAKLTSEICPNCGRAMVIKVGRYGKFLACSGYPECKTTRPLIVKTGIPCPECGSELVERINRRKRIFYGCSNFPHCQFATSRKPVPQPCPHCGKLLILYSKERVKCITCGYESELSELESARIKVAS